MGILTFKKYCIPGVKEVSENQLPPWDKTYPLAKLENRLDESDEVFLNYGTVSSCFPYREQNKYSRNLEPKEMLWAILENNRLRAVFAPEVGGKLWSLYDKRGERELLLSNPIFQPANYAKRNAWTSGGVEWNCGIFGHHVHTCDPLFTANLQTEDGEPVLRMYEYERIRGAVYQMDFMLPEDSPVLCCHMRIVNPHEEVIPMYWWSNICVPSPQGTRVVTDANETYSCIHGVTQKFAVPHNDLFEQADVTYPENTPVSIDYFWKVNSRARSHPFSSYIDKDGHGMFQASTERLQGRKMFILGQTTGCKRIEEFLLGSQCDGTYVEIQAGLAKTQYESLPMPPKTAWEWVEVYGPLEMDPSAVHGDWNEAIYNVSSAIVTAEEEMTPDKLFPLMHEIALLPANKLVLAGSGWGALECTRRKKEGLLPLEPHLDFGSPSNEQRIWIDLLETGTMTADANIPPISWNLGAAWENMLVCANEKEHPGWLVPCELAGIRFTQLKLPEAKALFFRSLEEQENAWAYYGLSCCARFESKPDLAIEYAMKAYTIQPQEDIMLHAVRMQFHTHAWGEMLKFMKKLPEDILSLPRMQYLKALALVHMDKWKEAEAIIIKDGKILEIPDTQEGELSMTSLWYLIHEKKANANGLPFDADTIDPPYEFDYRTFPM